MSTDTDATGQLGINLVERVILRDLRWAFRVQYVSDQGVDAQAESKIDGRTTGRLIALQIKAGRSWFSEPTVDGWIFRFDEKKARLWFGHALPVAIVLVDIFEEVAYWQRIDSATAESTGKDYRVLVPRTNRLDAAAEAWTHIVSGIENRAVERYDFACGALAPDTRSKIELMHRSAPTNAAVLALHLAEGRSNAVDTARAILTADPHWIAHPDGLGWRALASFALNYDARAQAADALEKAASEDSRNIGRRLAGAALAVMAVDPDRASQLLATAERHGAPQEWISICRAFLNHPEGDAHPFEVAAEDDLHSYVEPNDESIVSNFLAEQAARRGDLDQALRRSRETIDRVAGSSELKIRHAQWLIMRAAAADNQDRDLASAKDVLIDAILERRSWGGDALEALDCLLRVLALQGDFESMLAWSTLPPDGMGSPDEVSDPLIVRHAVTAAHLLGRRELVASLATGLGVDADSELLKARVGLIDLEPDREVSLLSDVINLAWSKSDYSEIVRLSLRLAHLGVDVSTQLEALVQSGIIQDQVVRLIKAVASTMEDFDEGVRELRVLARADPAACDVLFEVLKTSGRHQEAADAADAAYKIHKLPYFLILHADALLDADQLALAEQPVVRALAAVQTGYSVSRARFYTFLAGRAADRGDWPEAEANIHAAIHAQSSPSPGDYWRLVTTQLAQGQDLRAAKVVRDQDLTPRNVEEARYWLRCQYNMDWDQVTASRALSIALQFSELDPQLSAAYLTHIVAATRGEDDGQVDTDHAGPSRPDFVEEESERVDWRPVVSEGIHREAFAALSSLLDQHGEATGIQEISGTDEEMLGQLSELLRAQSSEPVQELLSMVRLGRIPVGAAVTALGRCYATVLIERSTGLQIAAAADDAMNEADVEDARWAIGSSVVVEASSLLLVSQVGGSDGLSGRFSNILLPASSRLDILRAGVEVRGFMAAGGGSVAWDPNRQGIVVSEMTSQDYVRLRARSDALERMSAQTVVETLTGESVLPSWTYMERGKPWLDPIDLAAERSLALWSDDTALRMLARSVGVRTFGTPALVEAYTTERLRMCE